MTLSGSEEPSIRSGGIALRAQPPAIFLQPFGLNEVDNKTFRHAQQLYTSSLSPLAKDRGSHPDYGRAFFNRNFKIMTHAHRQLAPAFAEMLLLPQFVAQLAQRLEIRARAIRVFKVRRQGHETR